MNLPDLDDYLKKHKPTKDSTKKLGKRLLRYFGYLVIVFLSALLFIWFFFGRSPLVQPEDIKWGVTYSPLATEGFRMDSDEVLDAIVTDLKPDSIRLVAYWNRIETSPGQFDFSDLRSQVDKTNAAEIPHIISVGRRVPRYPECHEPEWVEQLSESEQNIAILRFIRATIEEFDDSEYLIMWQIENEPFLGSFGDCPPLDEDFLETEINFARELTDKRIMTTESGELSVWAKASKHPDVLGTTLYRRVIVQGTNLAVNHIYPPWYYRARSNIVKTFRGNLQNVIVAELQAEPWANVPIIDATDEELERTMNPKVFEDNIKFTESVGFPEVYLWGVEWWYFEKERGNDYYWERARDLFGTKQAE